MVSVLSVSGPRPWPARWVTLVLWALAAASVVVWGLRLSAPRVSAAPASAPVALPAPDAQAIAQLLGAVSAAGTASKAPAAASRFALIGVLAGQNPTSGAALIAVAGAPAQTFRIGASVDGDLVLQSVGPHGVELGPVGQASAFSLSLREQP